MRILINLDGYRYNSGNATDISHLSDESISEVVAIIS